MGESSSDRCFRINSSRRKFILRISVSFALNDSSYVCVCTRLRRRKFIKNKTIRINHTTTLVCLIKRVVVYYQSYFCLYVSQHTDRVCIGSSSSVSLKGCIVSFVFHAIDFPRSEYDRGYTSLSFDVFLLFFN